MTPKITRWAAIAGALMLSAVLAWAAVLKAVDPALFADNIMNFRVVPRPVAAALALYLPWLELFIAGGLVVPRWRSGGALLATAVFAVFALLWVITWVRGLDVACGCFGGEGRTSAAWAFMRTAALTAVGASVFRHEMRANAYSRRSARGNQARWARRSCWPQKSQSRGPAGRY